MPEDKSTNMPWPRMVFTLPDEGDDETIGLLSQAALEAGALGTHHEAHRVYVYLPREADAALIDAIQQAMAAEMTSLGWVPPSFTLDQIEDSAWATAWKDYFTSLPVGRRLLLRPEWEKDQTLIGEAIHREVILFRPGLGFGTGKHESTFLAITLMERAVTQGMMVLDFGSGSGILGIGALKLGAAEVTAVEFDEDANENARDNLMLNGLTGRMEILEDDNLSALQDRFDLILCNMITKQALPHLPAMSRLLRDSQSKLIYSGFLTEQKKEVEAAFLESGLRVWAYETINEWSALTASW